MELKHILEQVKTGALDVKEAERLIELTSSQLEYAHLDFEREARTGFPEVIYAAGKSNEQLIGIFERLMERQSIVMATRVSVEQAAALTVIPAIHYHADARVAIWSAQPIEPVREGYVAIVAAGTSDWSVAQEAAWTVRCFGSEARLIMDVGVAGIHRLFQRLEEIRGASVIVCVAGMEGALASVIAGLVTIPVIAVPTSVGYGANLQGMSALLTMLNSCANGIAVVNIDNGFGAGYMAGLIHRQTAK